MVSGGVISDEVRIDQKVDNKTIVDPILITNVIPKVGNPNSDNKHKKIESKLGGLSS